MQPAQQNFSLPQKHALSGYIVENEEKRQKVELDLKISQASETISINEYVPSNRGSTLFPVPFTQNSIQILSLEEFEEALQTSQAVKKMLPARADFEKVTREEHSPAHATSFDMQSFQKEVSKIYLWNSKDAKAARNPNELAETLVNKVLDDQVGSFKSEKTLRLIGSEVTSLTIRTGELKSKQIKELSELFPNLEYLAITQDCEFEFCEDLQDFKKVTIVSLRFNKTADAIHLEYLPPSTKTLYLCDCHLTDDVLVGLEKLENLTSLDISDNANITGSTLGYLSFLLKTLRCRCCSINDTTLKILQRYANLESLEIGGNTDVTGSTFYSLPSGIKTLYIDLCNITDQSIQLLAPLGGLKMLSVSHNKKFTGSYLSYVTRDLEILNASYCNLDENSIQGLTSHDKLQIVSIYGNMALSRESVQRMLAHVEVN